MTSPLSLLSEEEVSRCRPADEEAGFGTLSTARGQLPLRAMDVQARIDGLLSEVILRQTFVNTLGEPIEATYIFPLPDRAAVTRFRMEVAGRVVEGVLRERGEARRQYNQAIRSGQRAAITEEERSGVFTLRVGNLMPGEAAVIDLTLIGPLQYSDGEATFRFPLVVAPRYIPGQALPGRSVGDGTATDTDAVPDASRITPPVLLEGYPNPVRLSLAVAVHPGSLLMRDFRSSLHSVMQEADSEGVRHIQLQPGERLNRDFILRFRLAGEAIQTSLAIRPDADGSREGTFLLTLVPPLVSPKVQRPRDVVFILDRSGSMSGWKMVAARRALARMVDTLTERDRFTVYAFDDHIETPPAFGGLGLVEATDRQRFRAVEFLAKIDSRGGTEMAQPLDLGATQLAGNDPGRDRNLILVTDGQVGNEDQILRLLGQRVQHIRIFTLGIDQAVNEAFLKKLAQLGGGFCELVESEDRLDDVMDKVHRRIGTAVIAGLKVRSAGLGIEADSLVPGRLPDLFAGAPLFILGRYRGAADGSLAVEGHGSTGEPWAKTVPAKISASQAVPCVWARGRIRELEDRFVIGSGDQRQLEKQIVETSLKFGVLCRFTAFVAVDRVVVNPTGQVHKVAQAVEKPAGWEQQAADKGKTMLAKQVLQELNADGRVSKKTQLAMDDAARDDSVFCDELAEACEPSTGVWGAQPPAAPPRPVPAMNQAPHAAAPSQPAAAAPRGGFSAKAAAPPPPARAAMHTDRAAASMPSSGKRELPPEEVEFALEDSDLCLSAGDDEAEAPTAQSCCRLMEFRPGAAPGKKSAASRMVQFLAAPFLLLYMIWMVCFSFIRWTVRQLRASFSRKTSSTPTTEVNPQPDTADRGEKFWK